jgi:major membrane immunogen (membrane-anchored lipoprotein)
MKKTLCLIATLLIAPILLAACGGGDISGDTSIDDGVDEVAVTAMTNKDKIGHGPKP